MDQEEIILQSSFQPLSPEKVAARNFGAFLQDGLGRYPDSRWIDGCNHVSSRYDEVSRQATEVRAGLHSLGLTQTDILYVFANNSLMLLPAFLGAFCGNIPVMFQHPDYGVDTLVKYVGTICPTVLCCEPESLNKAIQLKEKWTSVKHVIVLGELEEADRIKGFITWNELLIVGKEGEPLPAPQYIPDHPCFMPSTSGTTGEVKVVVHTHESMVASALAVGQREHHDLAETEIVLGTGMVGHTYSFFAFTCRAILLGISAVFLRKPDDDFLEALQTYRVTTLCTKPFAAEYLLADPRVAQYDLSALRHITTATYKMRSSALKELHRKFHLRSVGQEYGQTEFPAIATVPWGLKNFESVGKLAFNVEAMIVHAETGKSLGPGESGELYVRGPALMRGYSGRPSLLATELTSWWKTGDICHYDAEGWLYYEERASDMLICRGVKMAPQKLEAALLSCPEVADCAVFGVPDAVSGKLPHAIIVPKTNNVDSNVFLRFFRENMPGDYHLAGVTLTDVIPRNPLGKVLRRELWKLVSQ